MTYFRKNAQNLTRCTSAASDLSLTELLLFGGGGCYSLQLVVATTMENTRAELRGADCDRDPHLVWSGLVFHLSCNVMLLQC